MSELEKVTTLEPRENVIEEESFFSKITSKFSLSLFKLFSIIYNHVFLALGIICILVYIFILLEESNINSICDEFKWIYKSRCVSKTLLNMEVPNRIINIGNFIKLNIYQ